MIQKATIFGAALLAVAAIAAPAKADPARDAIIAGYAAQAGGNGFSAARGQAFYVATQTGGKPDTPSCASCHTENPHKPGMTRAGKVIDPMAVSAAPDRFTDLAKVEKWFGRNCNSVLGRECTASEKGDILAYFSSL